MSLYSLAQFLEDTADQPTPDGSVFELESDYMLQVNLNGMVWIKRGAMVAYRGDISFKREGMLAQGIGGLIKKAVTGEGAKLSMAQGRGQLYLADKGKRISVLDLAGESIVVNGNDLLCFEPQITNEITMMRKLSAIVSGGLFNVRLTGRGLIAITTHHRPVTLMVEPGRPVFTDPQATVAWSASLTPDYKTDIQLKSLMGRGSGESFQMKFDGSGYVIVQPYEEDLMQHDE